MSDGKPQYEAPQSQNAGSGASASASAPKVKPRNPAFVAMGLPRLRLPSRNWMIFLSIVGTWTAFVQYDRREKRIATQKWTRLVADLKNDALPLTALQRKLTIVLAAPPADSIIVAREHFHEYVKPVLEESGLDWDAVEGRREGEIRAGMAERIRKLRQKKGEPTDRQLEDWEILLDDIRSKMGIHALDSVAGDIVIGRHTWKEYVRGLHEGWLGPMDLPAASVAETTSAEEQVPQASPPSQAQADDPLLLNNSNDDASPTSNSQSPQSSEEPVEGDKKKQEEQEAEEEQKKKKKKKQPPPFISTADYVSATLSANCPEILGPSEPIPLPHLLGFFNFPIRINRYLHKRRLAESIGRQTAAAALATYRPYDGTSSDPSVSQDTFSATASLASGENGSMDRESRDDSGSSERNDNEIRRALEHEEKEWHKSIRKREGPPEEGREHTWTNDMVLDPRIAQRMRRFALTSEEEERAQRIDAQIRDEKWSKMFDVPARVWRGAMSTFGRIPTAPHPLDTVGDVSDLD